MRTVDLDFLFYPSQQIRLDQLAVEVSAHFHGVSHPSPEVVRHPYATTVLEGQQSRIRFISVTRCAESQGQAHWVSCRLELMRVPLGISCVTFTVSGERLDLCRAITLSVFKPLDQGANRFQIGHKSISEADINRTLSSAQQAGGTMTLAAIAMNCGWWHLYSSQSFFVNTSADDFMRKACYPRPVCARCFTLLAAPNVACAPLVQDRLLGGRWARQASHCRMHVHTLTLCKQAMHSVVQRMQCRVCCCKG